MPSITVSAATYNEIAAALQKQGLELDKNVTTLTIEKGTTLTPPIDYRLATIRRDCADIVGKFWKESQSEDYWDTVNRLYEYVLNGPKG